MVDDNEDRREIKIKKESDKDVWKEMRTNKSVGSGAVGLRVDLQFFDAV